TLLQSPPVLPNAAATTETSTLSLHDALPIYRRFIASLEALADRQDRGALAALRRGLGNKPGEVADVYPYVLPWLPSTASPREERSEEHTSELQSRENLVCRLLLEKKKKIEDH